MDTKIKYSLIGGIILIFICLCCSVSVIVGIYLYNSSNSTTTTDTTKTTDTSKTTDTTDTTKTTDTTDTTKTTDTTTTETTTTQSEVYHVSCSNNSYCLSFADAQAIAIKFGGTIATEGQLISAQREGADWCSSGWISSGICVYPISTQLRVGCGNGSAGIKTWTPSDKKCGVNVYGIKPTQSKATTTVSGYTVRPFNEFKWSQYTTTYEMKEVFNIVCTGSDRYCVSKTDAETIAKKFGGTVATIDQLNDTQIAGADWCSTGWLTDGECRYPITTSTQDGCGNGSAGVKTWKPSNSKCGVNVYAVKPTKDKATTTISGYTILPFNTLKWSRWE